MTEFVLSPEAKARVLRINILYSLAFALLFTGQAALAFFAGNTVNGWLFVGLVVFMVTGTLFAARRLTERSRLRFGDGTYEIRWSFRVQRFTTADISQVVTADSVSIGLTPAAPILMLVGPTKRRALLSGLMWSTDQLGALALDLADRGVPLLSYHERLTALQLRSMDRRWMSVWQAHPIAIGLLAGLAAILLAVVIAIVALAILL